MNPGNKAHPSQGLYARLLRQWATENPRPMPWKGIRDPYRIWLSEIILQQTRVAQGLPYYERFIVAYPTVVDLANAPDDAVFKLWEGLGYYSRARNMLAAARAIAARPDAAFPDNYEEIRQLKGVGDYTAAAISSFAFDLPYPVVDGNVYRVLARWFGNATPIDSTLGKQEFAALAREVLDETRPGEHNQAMMDFGATWCTPQNPKCAVCTFSPHCAAFLNQKVSELPVKAKKAAPQERFFLYLVITDRGRTFLKKRENKDIWQNLYDFPHCEPVTLPQDAADACQELGLPINRAARLSKIYRQTLTHRKVAAVFLEIERTPETAPFLENTLPVDYNALLPEIAVPRIVEWYWKDKNTAPTLF